MTRRPRCGVMDHTMHRLCFFYVIFFITAVLVLTVHLRTDNSRVVYRLCRSRVEQNRCVQQVGNRQLLLENLISPTAVSKHLGY